MSLSFSNNINSLNTTLNVTIPDDRSNILSWLSPLNPKLRHQDIQARRVENVGEWLLQTEEFKSWYVGSRGGESDKPVLFCYGDPGVGKTFISSLVIDNLCDWARGRDATVACFYFDFAAQKEQSPTSILGALLKQLVCGLRETPEEISRTYQDQRSYIGGRVPQFPDIAKMVQTTSSKKPTFICIDALDECAEGYRVKLLDSLNQILQKSPDTRIFVTGRPHIRPEIERRLGERVTNVSISPRKDDIIRYVHSRLHEDTIPDAMNSSLEAEILEKIPENFSEIFLLVSLNIDAILQETTIHRRRQKLNTITDGLGLGGAYSATLDRIKGQGGDKSRLGMAALMWVSHSERPLKPDELCHALAVEIGSPDLNPDNVPSIRTLITCCQGLIAVDKEASIVRLVHFTLQEYLRTHPEFFSKAHSTMAETCLGFLNSQQVVSLSASSSPDPQGIPFLEYSSLYWGIHAKNDLSDHGKQLALKLFSSYQYMNHISTKILLEAQRRYLYDVDLDNLSMFSGLHCASFFGIVEIVAGLVGVEGCNVTRKDCVGNTPPIWAALNGHDEVLKILLGRDDFNPDGSDAQGRTLLYCAARNGHEEVVKMLLERGDIDPDKPNKYGQTPLCSASLSGHEGVVKTLLERADVGPDKSDIYGQTPLHFAVSRGHEGVVKILLGRGGVRPDSQDIYGQTPLLRAAWGGHEGVVDILLGRDDVNPDKPDQHIVTPLWRAAANGHEGVVKILLKQDKVNPDKRDYFGRTPLSCAILGGHEGVVNILLGQDVCPDKPDADGRTPL